MSEDPHPSPLPEGEGAGLLPLPLGEGWGEGDATRTLHGKTLFITGASRGIGLAVALRAARDGANVVIAAKTDAPHPKLPGTIHTAAAEVEAAGGRALAAVCDVRDEAQIVAAMAAGVDAFGGIDVLVNNASAIALTGTEATDAKRYDLMQQVNARATFLCAKHAIPHLRRAENPHILTMSPPLNLDPGWIGPHIAYTLSKYGMTLTTLGLAYELRGDGIAANCLWPSTTIATAAIANLLGGPAMLQRSRTTAIVADAAHIILTRPATQATGQCYLDDAVLRESGVDELSGYAVTPGATLAADFFLGSPVSPRT